MGPDARSATAGRPATPAEAVRASSLAELAWTGADGSPRAAAVMALTRGEQVLLALTFDRAALARDVVAARGPVVVALTEPRGAAAGFRSVGLVGRPRLEADTQGQVYADELRLEELRRYPPARLLADSPLLCREHWWWLPRLLVTLEEPVWVPLPARTEPQDHLLVAAGPDRPAVAVVRLDPEAVVEPDRPELSLTVLGGSLPDRPGPAVVLGQDASFPDLERWASWQWEGLLQPAAGGRPARLAVSSAPASTGCPPVPGVWQRWRRQRALARACREGLGAW
ncbi:pyridoxamine 5'-phosphate oxidase family protein [Ornithinicoccus halotolerans]|uniref:pyridoxamine 5'-phosphate oxidase family protein n=1 Tax=Ornithinicoccus halotolerans TaxID=1748220 RepID=UPI0012962D6D|nr:pyridoxamine 5'-phosphate oxidase family protein [Ornithinicoccus halotolerans]